MTEANNETTYYGNETFLYPFMAELLNLRAEMTDMQTRSGDISKTGDRYLHFISKKTN